MIKGLINLAMKKVQQTNDREVIKLYENLGLSTKFVKWKAKLCLLN